MEDEAIRVLVLEVWGQVMHTGNRVIAQWTEHGYEEMGIVPDPNIHALLVEVRKLEEMMDKILASEHLDYSQSRMLINAKQQVLWMELLAAALTNDQRSDFDDVITKLKNQPHI